MAHFDVFILQMQDILVKSSKSKLRYSSHKTFYCCFYFLSFYFDFDKREIFGLDWDIFSLTNLQEKANVLCILILFRASNVLQKYIYKQRQREMY